MTDLLANLLALRAHLDSLVVCTTGDAVLGSTATGYERAVGSFLADGFRPGMEVRPEGFAHAAPGLIAAVDDATLTLREARPVETAAAGRRLVVGLPAARIYENVGGARPAGEWWVEEEYLPGPSTAVTLGAWVEDDPTYIVRLAGITGTGPVAILTVARAVLAHFRPGLALPTAAGEVLRVRGDPAPFAGQILPGETGRPIITITVPLRVRTLNTGDTQ